MVLIQGFKVRTRVLKGDNLKLLALEKETPMRGFVSVYFDHSPDLFRFFNLFGKVEPFIVEDKGKVIAYLGASVLKVVIKGKPVNLVVGTNLRVNPEYRGRGIASKLLRYAFNVLRKKYEVLVTFNMESNKPISVISKKFPEFTFNPLYLYQFLPFKKYKVSNDYKIMKAKRSDIPKIVSLLKNYYNNYFVSPSFSLSKFKQELKNTPKYDLSNILLARKGSEIVACLGLWDQRSVRKVVVVDMPFKLKVLRQVMRFSKFFMRVPQIPSLGGEINIVHFRHIAFKPGFDGAFKDLLSSALNYCRLNNYLLAFIGATRSDPIIGLFKDFLKLRNKVYMGFHDTKGKISEEDLKKPFYIDTSIL